MLKLTSLAIGVLTLISIAPAAQADLIHGPSLQPQITVTIGTPPRPEIRPQERRESVYHRQEARQREIARERESHARWEAKHRHHERYSQDRHEERREERRDERNRDYNNDGYRR
jgi:hypothetical protein